MEAQTKKSLRISLIASAIFIAGFFFNYFVTLSSVKVLNDSLQSEQMQNTKLLAQNKSAAEQLVLFKKLTEGLQNENKRNQQQLTDAFTTIQKQLKLIADANHKSNMFSSMKTQITDLKNQKSDLETKVNDLKSENIAMKNSQTQMNSTIAMLTDENQKLKENNSIMSSMMTNNSLVEAKKGKHDKLTVVARKTNKLQSTFDLPASMVEHLSFKIISPNAEIHLNGQKEIITYQISESENINVFAGLNEMVGAAEKTKRIKLTFIPSEKLEKGTYTIIVMNNNMEIGKMQENLR